MALHIIPINDLKDHLEQSTCECCPTMIIENGEMIFIHKSYDKRELKEKMMENNFKLPSNCPHCGELVNYLNHKHHLYMYCDKLDAEEVLISHWDKIPKNRSKELEWHTIIEAMKDYAKKYHNFENNLFDIPIELQKYFIDLFKNISKIEGEINKISQYGGSVFVTFKNNRTYRINIGLYNNEATLD